MMPRASVWRALSAVAASHGVGAESERMQSAFEVIVGQHVIGDAMLSPRVEALYRISHPEWFRTIL